MQWFKITLNWRVAGFLPEATADLQQKASNHNAKQDNTIQHLVLFNEKNYIP